MTPSSPRSTPTPTPKAPRARRGRAKRGVVAGYIHDISPRHRAAEPAPMTAAVPAAPRSAAPAR
jgi:hypothetical protein